MITAAIILIGGIGGGWFLWDKWKKKDEELKRVKALLNESLTKASGGDLE